MSASIGRYPKALGYAVAVLALLVIAGGVAGRIAFPAIAGRPEIVSAYLSAFVKRPVLIGAVEAGWDGWRPRLRIHNLRLMNDEGSRPAIAFTEARVWVDLWGSLRSDTLALTGLELLGGDFMLVRTPAGQITVAGIDRPSDVLLRWLLAQPEVLIESTAIAWHDRRAGQGVWTLPAVRIRGQAHGREGRIDIQVELPPAAGERARLVLDGQRDRLNGEWSGRVYLEARGIRPGVLVDYWGSAGTESQGGSLGMHAWGEWRGGRLAEGTGEFEVRRLKVGRDGRVLELAEGKGRFGLASDAEGAWRIGIDGLRLITGSGSWPETRLALRLEAPDDQGPRALSVYASPLQVQDLWQWWRTLAPPEAKLMAALEGLAPVGELHEVRFTYSARDWSLRTQVDALTTHRHGRLPGIAGLSGSLEADANGGHLRLFHGPVEIDAPPVYPGSLALSEVRGELRWRREGDGWRISTPGLHAETLDLALDLQGQLHGSSIGNLTAEIYGTIEGGRLDRMEAYLPHNLPAGARRWLTRALKGGRIRSGSLVLRGPLRQFPFDGPEGRFAAALDLSEGVLDHTPGWPAIQGIAARVVFDGRALEVHGEGRVYGAVLREVEARIPDLGAAKPSLAITGTATGPAAAAQQFIAHSPLRERIGPEIRALDITGLVSLDLRLGLPFDAGPGGVAGLLRFSGNTLTGHGFHLRELTGALRFNRAGWSGEGLGAKLYSRPIQIGVTGDASWPQLRLTGRADRAFIGERLAALMPRGRSQGAAQWLSAISGETDWELIMDRPVPRAGTAFRLRSTLVGLKLGLPPPLAKGASESTPLEIRAAIGPAGDGSLRFSYSDRLRATLALNPDGARRRIAGSRITLGRGGPDTPSGGPMAPGLSIAGRVERLSLSAWAGFPGLGDLESIPARGGSRELNVDLSVAKLEALGFVFIDQRLRIQPHSDRWLVRLDGPDAQGQLFLPVGAQGRRWGGVVEADLEHLRLVRRPGGRFYAQVDPRRVPALAVRCAALRYEALALGAVRLQAEPWERGLSVPKLSFSGPAFELNAVGVWELDGGTQSSRFDLDVEARDLDGLLRAFGYHAVASEGGETAIRVAARWPGSPPEFTLSALSGTLRLEIREGRLLDVNQGLGRVFGLLSVPALWRRLRLDFSDIFRKGFTFDAIEGTFDVHDGNAYTSDLNMRGPTGQARVAGRTGLATRDYDQFVTVMPALATSLPLAPAVFIAGQAMPGLPERINSVLRNDYRITGPWSNPVIVRISSKDVPVAGERRRP